MKDQIEFHFAITEDPFVIDPADIRLVYRHLDGAMLATTWGEELEVSESYETVKRRIANFYKPLENVSGWPYGE